jgi:hypothetical protein
MTCHLTSSKFKIFSLISVFRLVHWSPVSALSPKIVGSSPIQFKKEEQNLKNYTRRAETRINFFTDSIRNQHPKLRVMNFARNFQGPKLRIWQKHPKLIPKFRLSGNRRIFRSFGRKWITVCCRNEKHSTNKLFSCTHCWLFEWLVEVIIMAYDGIKQAKEKNTWTKTLAHISN